MESGLDRRAVPDTRWWRSCFSYALGDWTGMCMRYTVRTLVAVVDSGSYRKAAACLQEYRRISREYGWNIHEIYHIGNGLGCVQQE